MILEVNLFAFACRLFHRDFSPINGTLHWYSFFFQLYIYIYIYLNLNLHPIYDQIQKPGKVSKCQGNFSRLATLRLKVFNMEIRVATCPWFVKKHSWGGIPNVTWSWGWSRYCTNMYTVCSVTGGKICNMEMETAVCPLLLSMHKGEL